MRRGARRGARWIALLLMAAAAVAVLPGCGPMEEPVAPHDTEGWPPRDRFVSTATVADAVRIRATVTLGDGRTRSAPDPAWAAAGEAGVPWRELRYEIWIEPRGGRVLRGVVAAARLNEAMARWIHSGRLDFGSDAAHPVDIGPGTASPRGLVVGRQTAVPDPSALDPGAARVLEAALRTPIWLKLTWDGEARFIRLEPGQDITYVGLASGRPGGAPAPAAAVQ
ncbi:MAG: hypothetical protein DIU76_04850 [Bacillota bacterium]|nr:MAG: hypothetical protein DIU76_04850 [Bacillota bacterium]